MGQFDTAPTKSIILNYIFLIKKRKKDKKINIQNKIKNYFFFSTIDLQTPAATVAPASLIANLAM